jgi:hypothetical protein
MSTEQAFPDDEPVVTIAEAKDELDRRTEEIVRLARIESERKDFETAVALKIASDQMWQREQKLKEEAQVAFNAAASQNANLQHLVQSSETKSNSIQSQAMAEINQLRTELQVANERAQQEIIQRNAANDRDRKSVGSIIAEFEAKVQSCIASARSEKQMFELYREQMSRDFTSEMAAQAFLFKAEQERTILENKRMAEQSQKLMTSPDGGGGDKPPPP